VKFFTMLPNEFDKHGKLACEHGFAVCVYKKKEILFVAVSPEIAVEKGIMERADMNAMIQVIIDKNADKTLVRSGKKR